MSDATLLNLWVILNSSVAWLLREITGRKNLGGGMLKAEATDLSDLPLYVELDHSSMIAWVADRLQTRQAKETILELDTDEHAAIDDIVFGALKLGRTQRKQVVGSLKTCLAERVKKSRSR